MAKPERQQNVLDLLKGLRGIEPLKQLFWSELNYQRVNEPLSRREWTESTSKALAEDPVLFAGGGENSDFHVIYGRLASDRLLLGDERPVVSRLVKEHPYALFVFSNKAQDRWHFLNVKYDDTAEKRRLFRRITIGTEERLRTASERISLLSLDAISPELLGMASTGPSVFAAGAIRRMTSSKTLKSCPPHPKPSSARRCSSKVGRSQPLRGFGAPFSWPDFPDAENRPT